jgi:membrane-bound lytic murein transglycosylase D
MKRFLISCCFVVLLQIVKANSPVSPAKLPVGQTSHQLTNPPLADTSIVPILNPAALISKSDLYKLRLDSIKKDIPLIYNEYVQTYIDLYLHNKDEMGQVAGLSKYYLPIYEKVFRAAGIPEEIKYLSVVESKLDPFAVSRVGATGPWQFMFTTARLYGLNIDSYIDERRDPVRASYAAAAYLKDAFNDFGDWLLAIASYNCGKSNVERAIAKSIRAGGAKDFWSIRQYLPMETRGYVPAFIAINYVMNYYSLHDITAKDVKFSLLTDTMMVNKRLSLRKVAEALGSDISELVMLNPQYKRQVLNGTSANPSRLVIPQVDKDKYGDLYNALNGTSAADGNVYAKDDGTLPMFHKVKRGETLRDIADKFGVMLQDLKVWNHLRGNKAEAGKKLRLTDDQFEKEATASYNRHKQHNRLVYTVRNGDTLSGIAAKFNGVSIEKIKAKNGLKRDILRPGMTIRI